MEIKSFIKRLTGYGKQETITHDPVRCKESCKYNAIVFNSMMNILNVVPEVISKKCVGCGACMVIYPENCITVNPILGSIFRVLAEVEMKSIKILRKIMLNKYFPVSLVKNNL